ncbi:lipase family alpha/beta hydrolase [Antrihabitans sp. NCIMB 15449]|uniref:Lipase family alpha/beta hydrolase n=1 Tax=Antrihabitans spumae TaxID=3373370 RepID=A0ABW7JJK7_9NOCA
MNGAEKLPGALDRRGFQRASVKRRIATVVAVTWFAVVFGTGPSVAKEPLPVPYSYFAGIQASVKSPGAAPPGSNDWNCKPTAEHPNPVVLVHGFLGTMTSAWQTLSPLLANNGLCVFALTYGVTATSQLGAMAAIEKSAAEVGQFIDRVRAATGTEQVDLVGHSIGATLPFYYYNYLGGAAKVRHHVGLAPWYRGTTQLGAAPTLLALMGMPGIGPAVLEQCGVCDQALVGSPFIEVLNANAAVAPGISFTNIMTRNEEVATPYTTGYLDGPNVTNIVVQERCSLDNTDHFQLPYDPIATQYVLNALDPAHAVEPQCRVVLPFVGAI